MINPIMTFVGIIFLMNIQTYAINQKIKLTGGVDGGGGKVVVFKDEKNQITKVQLLDLWEAEYLYGLKPVKLGNTVQEIVDNGILALKNSLFSPINHSYNGEPCETQECLQDMLKHSSEKFFSETSKLKRLRGVELISTNDSLELAKPKNADILQIVNYRPDGTVLIDQDLFELMDIENQAALIIHEVFYFALRSTLFGSEKNSIRVRRSVGFILSGGVFLLDKIPDFKRRVNCYSSLDTMFGGGSEISILELSNDDGSFAFYIKEANGSPLIGITQPHNKYIFSDSEQFFNGKCIENNKPLGAMWFNGNGPVEFDHLFKFEFKCEDNKVKTYFTETKQGSQEIKNELFCEY